MGFIMAVVAFAVMLGAAGGMFGIAIYYLCSAANSPSKKLGAGIFGVFAGLTCGFYLGVGGLRISAAQGVSWYGQRAGTMFDTGIVTFLLAGGCLVVVWLVRNSGDPG